MENNTPDLRLGIVTPELKIATSAFIAQLLASIGDADLTAHPAFYLFTGRRRIVGNPARESINAVLRVVIASVDITTATTTIKQTDIVKVYREISVTRISRAVSELVRIGAICRKAGTIVITPIGMGIYGTSQAEWKAEALKDLSDKGLLR